MMKKQCAVVLLFAFMYSINIFAEQTTKSKNAPSKPSKTITTSKTKEKAPSKSPEKKAVVTKSTLSDKIVKGKADTSKAKASNNSISASEIVVGAAQTWKYFPLLRGRRFGVMVNPSSMIGSKHLVDVLIENKLKPLRIFAPEHGYKGEAEAGEKIKDGKDSTNQIEIISLYGKKVSPDASKIKDLDVIVFDIQDAGTRFFTYLSSLYHLMRSAGAEKKTFIVLDRPNPNGHYVDGPMLEDSLKSFVGAVHVPIVHGMTLGEIANMLVGEKLIEGVKLEVIACKGYDHSHLYYPPVPPSPNLRSTKAILLYPSLCLFEGTNVSVGRGTDSSFEIAGAPWFTKGKARFIPRAIAGRSQFPPYQNQWCLGYSWVDSSIASIWSRRQIDVEPLIQFYRNSPDTATFFTDFFDKLAGTRSLKQQIIAGWSEWRIRNSWKPDLTKFKAIRKKYLLYPDFTE
jgi:uncharacterized protein YbbC (DUF1343 family)